MKLTSARTAQTLLNAEFAFNYNDWCTDTVSGVKETFGSTVALADPSASVPGLVASNTGVVLDVIPMPQGAVLVGGEVIVETAYAGIGASATLSVGIAGSGTALVSGLDLDAASAGSKTDFTLSAPLTCNAGQNLRLTIAGMTAGGATAGKVRVRVRYTIDGRSNEVVIA